VLEIENLHAGYGPSQVLFDLSMKVEGGEIVSIIGRNGVGKTSTIKAIMGLIDIVSGSIRFDSTEISRLPTYKRGRLGIAYVPDDRGIFGNVTTAENLRIPLIGHKMREGDNLELVFSLFPILQERWHQKAGTLSGGEQQMLAIGRALMSRPRLLLLDEPSLGLSPILVEKIFSVIQKVRQEGGTVLLVEQNARQALEIADRGYVLETGKIILQGSAQELRTNQEVEKAYLGG
jgi:branched-chain amino acid transport system ATP-binding protein